MNEPREMIVIIRPSFKKICADDACQAALLNHFLYWIAQKAKGQPKQKIQSGEISWYGSAEEICFCLARSWSVNKVRKEVKALVDAGLIGQRHNPANRWDQTRHYFFGEEQGNMLREKCKEHGICLAHLGLPSDMLHFLNLVISFPNLGNEIGNSNCQNWEIDSPAEVIPSAIFGNAIPKETTKEHPKETTKDQNKGNGEPKIGNTQESHETDASLSPLSQKKSSEKKDDVSLKGKMAALLDAWDKIEGHRAPRTEKQKKAAKELVEVAARPEDLVQVRQFCYQSNPEWYAKQGVDLPAIANNWGKWKSTQNARLIPPSQMRVEQTPSQRTSNSSAVLDEEKNKRNQERYLALMAADVAKKGAESQ